tara:strand:+ start:58 stop:1536 length:1479 start_codon:yes stop_codon:yes gene_type:complete
MSFATSPSTLANLSHLTPRPVKGLFGDNYLSIAGNDFNFTKQFLPEVYEKEVERYGNRTISGFLRMVGAEMPMASDTVTWSEQGRLHIAFDDGIIVNPSVNQLTLPEAEAGLLRALGGQTIALSTGYKTVKAYIVSVGAAAGGVQIVTVAPYSGPDLTELGTTGVQIDNVKVFIYGSEYAKGSGGAGAAQAGNSVDASFTPFSNKPIILRDRYTVNGSDVAQIGWVEVTTEAGTGGYLWYLKSEHEARLRFEDQLEMSMIEAEKAAATSAAITPVAGTPLGPNAGSEGLFAAVETRGLVYNDADFDGQAAGEGIAEFDAILSELDKQGAIEENMLFLNRSTALSIDNMIAQQNSYGAGGTSYGVFENSEDMALNLGFSGFRRGSYDFYKTDWKYLNDSTTRGLTQDVNGIIVPAGVSTVYDQQLGSNISRPFLHIRYRASEADDRRMKSWVTGSVGGNFTSDVDEMNVHFLSERCLCVQAANNFVMLKSTQE